MNFKFLSIVLILVFLLLIISLFFIHFNTANVNINQSSVNNILKLGYCPTMENNANKIALSNKNIHLIKYSSTIDVLKDLNENKIDIGLVGRVAKSDELKKEFNELRLDKGFTLVNSQKKIIPYYQLKNIQIHTYLHKEEVQNFLGNIDNVIFYESIKDIKSNEILLIDWTDYSEDYELLIPIDENNMKIEKFRIPVLYSYINLNNLELTYN